MNNSQNHIQKFRGGTASKNAIGLIAIVMTGILVLLCIHLELDNRNLHQEIEKLQANACDNGSCRVQFGELAKRIAWTEFLVENPTGVGMIDIEAEIKLAVKAVELSPGAQPFQLEDAIFISDASQQNPVFPKGPAWQFTLQVQERHFIVEVSAVSGEVIFKNQIY